MILANPVVFSLRVNA